MPPKRKASTTTDDIQPAPKRSLRSNKAAAGELVAPPPSRPGRSKRATAADEAATDVDPPPQGASVASRTRKAAPRSTAGPKPEPGPSRPRVIRQKKPTTTNGRRTRVVVESDNDEPDELLLSPSKKPPTRPTTPPRVSTPKAITPRFVLDCVEIRTPAPRPASGPLNSAQLGDTVDARSSTPSPTKRIGPPHSAFKPQLLEPVRPPDEPEEQESPSSKPVFALSTPRKQQPRARSPTLSPSKRRPTNAQKSPSRSKDLASHLYPCLYAQQRAILHALHHVSDIEQEHNEDMPTNAVALEELSSLLRGTVLRGEGNSCLLIGPRGSGKTRVRCVLFYMQPRADTIFRLWRRQSLHFQKGQSSSACRDMRNKTTV